MWLKIQWNSQSYSVYLVGNINNKYTSAVYNTKYKYRMNQECKLKLGKHTFYANSYCFPLKTDLRPLLLSADLLPWLAYIE